MTPEQQAAARPDWLSAWADYPHGSLGTLQARQIVWYAIHCEDAIAEKDKRIAELEAALQPIVKNAGDSIELLEKAGMGQIPGRSNTLVGMVVEAAERIAAQDAEIAEWRKSVMAGEARIAELEADIERLQSPPKCCVCGSGSVSACPYSDAPCKTISTLTRNDALTDALKAAQEAIEGAGHDPSCASEDLVEDEDERLDCDCWKHNALAAIDAAREGKC